MTDDLVRRLRAEDPETGLRWSLASESSDRIEKLEAALKHCINALREYEMGDDRPRCPIPNDDLRSWLLGAMDTAIKALEGKDE